MFQIQQNVKEQMLTAPDKTINQRIKQLQQSFSTCYLPWKKFVFPDPLAPTAVNIVEIYMEFY